MSRGTNFAELPPGWQCYLLLCSDQTYYCGITNNLSRRLRHHASGKGGKYTKGKRPVALVWYEPHRDRDGAASREKQLKSWGHKKKSQLALGRGSLRGVGMSVWVSLGPPPAVSG